MHRYTATVTWDDPQSTFASGRYSRAHSWTFDGGVTVPASSSPQVVRLPFSKEDAVDPEEAYVASLSSCHMLTFLFLASQAKFVVRRYEDRAEGFLEKDEAGREWVSRVELHPEIDFVGPVPDPEALARLHHRAHEECYIANSVKTRVVVDGR